MEHKAHRAKGDLGMELIRKGVHILTGILIVLGFQTGLLTLGLGVFIVLVYAALVLFNYRYERELLSKVLTINRADERIPGLSALAYGVGCLVVLFLFEPRIAYASILILAFGDALSHLIGRGFGGSASVTRTSYIMGTIAGIIAGTFAAWLYVPFWHAFIAAAIAMFVEAGELRIAEHYVDDNVTIPIVAGTVLWVIALGFPF